jgi:hypothetical protein
MAHHFGKRLTRRLLSRRRLACVLLFLVVSDIGFHVAESFLSIAEESPIIAFRAGHGNLESGCGIPDHDGTPFHHHHFPGFISQSSFALRLSNSGWISAPTTPDVIRPFIIAAIGRAPPLS